MPHLVVIKLQSPEKETPPLVQIHEEIRKPERGHDRKPQASTDKFEYITNNTISQD